MPLYFYPPTNSKEEFAVSFLLHKARERRRACLTPLQVNKLAYICHGWMLGKFGHPLLENNRRQIQAWKYGPVVVGIYHRLKPFGRSPVTLRRLREFEEDYTTTNSDEIARFRQESSAEAELLDSVYDAYGNLEGERLIAITHKPGGPWDVCRARGLGKLVLTSGGAHITDGVIESYYRKLAKRAFSSHAG